MLGELHDLDLDSLDRWIPDEMFFTAKTKNMGRGSKTRCEDQKSSEWSLK